MNAGGRARAARKLELGYHGLRSWVAAYDAHANKTLQTYRQLLTAPPGQRPTLRSLAGIAIDGWALPLKVPAGSRGATPAAGTCEGAKEWLLDVWAASVDWWATLLGCAHEEDLRFEFDEAAEMVGPGFCSFLGGLSGPLAITDLVHEKGLAMIPNSYIVARVIEQQLVVSLVNLSQLNPSLAAGAYHGAVTVGSSVHFPVSAIKMRP